MQNVQVLLQPTEIATQAEYGDSRLAGRTDGNRSSDSAISTWASLLDPGAFEQRGQRADVVRAEHHVDPRGPVRDHGPVLLRQAAADGDLHAGMSVLDRQQVTEVPVQPVVGVLAHGAGVEDHDVGLGAVGGLAVAGLLEQAGEPLGVVHVHLAPVGADFEGPLTVCARHAP